MVKTRQLRLLNINCKWRSWIRWQSDQVLCICTLFWLRPTSKVFVPVCACVIITILFNLHTFIQLLLLLFYYYYYYWFTYLFFLLFNCLDSLHSRCKGDIILFRNKVSSLSNEVYFLLMTNRRRVDWKIKKLKSSQRHVFVDQFYLFTSHKLAKQMIQCRSQRPFKAL